MESKIEWERTRDEDTIWRRRGGRMRERVRYWARRACVEISSTTRCASSECGTVASCRRTPAASQRSSAIVGIHDGMHSSSGIE
eukprot:2929469-Pyramimonas_sp.AAC.1